MTGDAAARRVLEDAIARACSPPRHSTSGERAASIWSDAIGTLTFDATARPASARDAVRSGVADQGDRDDERRHGAGADGSAPARRAGVRVLRGMARRGSRRRDRPRAARARVGVAGAPGRPAAGRRGASSSTTSARCRSNTRRDRRPSTAISGSSCSGFSWRIAAGRRSRSSSIADHGPPAAGARAEAIGDCEPTPDLRSSARPAIARRADADRWTTMRGAGACSSAKSTTTTRPPSAAPPATRVCSAPRPRSARSPRSILRAARGDADTPVALHAGAGGASSRTNTSVPGSSRALGWDTMLPTSSCGTRMSRARVRPRRLHGHVALDRSGARSLLRAADQSRLRRRHARADADRAPRVSRRAGGVESQSGRSS